MPRGLEKIAAAERSVSADKIALATAQHVVSPPRS